jgi:hypothetical protein
MAKQLPDFDLLVPWYPGKDRTAESVKQEIGGDVNSKDIDDTCIVRLSKPLNYNNHKIPAWTEKFRTRKGTDKMWYGLRVKEFWPYMEKIYGPPTRYSKQPIDAKKFEGIRGIIGFRVPFADGSATGHFTLWDGFNLLYTGGDHDYFKIATEAALWEAGNTRISEPDA